MHLFVIWDTRSGGGAATYPPERIDFDTTDIPEPIAKALEEAITCHANQCYTASAIMIRKTLEEICHHHGASDDNLKKRIAKLQPTLVIPKELLEALDALRLLGNDAAHVELKDFDSIGKDETDAGINLAKELLKGIFQYRSLLNQLNKLKKTQSSNQ